MNTIADCYRRLGLLDQARAIKGEMLRRISSQIAELAAQKVFPDEALLEQYRAATRDYLSTDSEIARVRRVLAEEDRRTRRGEITRALLLAALEH